MTNRVFLAAITALVSAVPASWGEGKVTICHFPPGNPANVQIITIGESALSHHIGNHPGDGIYGQFPQGDACGVVTGPPVTNPGTVG
jgi:hypothetical protein